MLCRHLLMCTALFVSPMLIGNEQVSGAEDSEIALDVREILKDLEELQKARKTGEIEWEWKLIEAIELGPPAVPELVLQLDATPKDNRLMLRTIPFILRGIGDRRATPGLIRAIPKCYGKDGSDMGYRCDDPELFQLLQKYDNSERKDKQHYSYGRPINEVFRTLEKWAGEDHGWTELSFVSEQGTPRQKFLKRKMFETHARRWEKWWLDNWQTFTDDANYSRVDFPEFEADENPEYQLDRTQPLSRNSGAGNMILSSYLDQSDNTSRRVFFDLDTGRKTTVPEKWRKSSTAERKATATEIRKWATEEGFDLIGTTVEQDGREYYVIESLNLEAWQLPESTGGFDNMKSAQDFIDEGRKTSTYLAWFDADENDYDFNRTGKFFYITSNGTPGLLKLGVEVYDTNVVIGSSFDGDDDLNPVGFYKGRRFSISYAE